MIDKDYISILKKNDFENNPKRFIFIDNSYDLHYKLIHKYKDILIDDYYCAMQSLELDPIITSIILNINLNRYMFIDDVAIDKYIMQQTNQIDNSYIYSILDKNLDIINKIFDKWFNRYIFNDNLIIEYLMRYYKKVTDITFYTSNISLLKIKSIVSTYIFNNYSYDKLINYKDIYDKYYYQRIQLVKFGAQYLNNIKQTPTIPKYVERIYVSKNNNIVTNFYDKSSSILLYIDFITATLDNNKKLLFSKSLITLDYFYSRTNPLDNNNNFIMKIIDKEHPLTYQDIIDNHTPTYINEDYVNILNYFNDYYYNNSKAFVLINRCFEKSGFDDNSIKTRIFMILLNQIYVIINDKFKEVTDKFFENYPEYKHSIIFELTGIYSYYPVICNSDNIVTLLQPHLLDNDNNIEFYLTANARFSEFAFAKSKDEHLMDIHETYNILIKTNINNPISNTKIVTIDNYTSMYSTVNKNVCYDIILEVFEKLFAQTLEKHKESFHESIDNLDELISRVIVTDRPHIYYNGNIDDFLIELNYYFHKEIGLNDFIVKKGNDIC